jgi:hypothetical protein
MLFLMIDFFASAKTMWRILLPRKLEYSNYAGQTGLMSVQGNEQTLGKTVTNPERK